MLLRMGLAPRPERHVRHSSIVIVMQIIVLASASSLDYEVPEPAIEAFQPKGLAVSIPDSEGIELFAFHANINKPLEGVEAGELSADVTHMSSDGRWTYRDAGRRLQVGDVIHYWLYVQRGGRGYQRLNQRHRIHALQSHEVDGNSASLDRPATIFIARPSDGGKVSVSSDDVQYRPPTPFRPPPPLYNSQPPPYDPYRPIDVPPGGATPDNLYGARPPPPPSYNHQYPPPPPPSGPLIHNHHVGFATESGNHHLATSNTNNGNNYSVDRYPAINAGGGSNYNSADRYPPTSNTQPVYRPEPVDGVDVTFSAVSPTASGSQVGQVGQGAQEELGVGAENGGTQTLSSGDPFAVHAPTPPATVCELSATFVNGHRACKGQVVFEEDWRSLDLGKWSHEVKISGSPDYEFCVYTRHPDNSFVKHGLLHVKPTLTNDRYGADFIRKGKLELDDCTAGPINSDCCSREAMFSYILPPVITSRVNTKNSFSFKYGRVDIRTRLPRGDWIYPEVWLQPAREEYGPGLSSGRILLAMARGNRNLRGPSAEDLSGKQLMVGVLAGGRGGTAGARKKFFTRDNDVGLWTDQFHNYTLLWTPETLAFSVDGIEIGVARPEEFGGLLHGQEGDEVDPWSQDGSRIAPFDKEFYISLGLAVGGVHAFPDGCKSGRHEKPWKNTAAKAVLSFWNARDVWHSTWNGQQSELLVESVRVTALNT